MENIDTFLKVAEKMGVAPEHKFLTEDLFYGNNLPKVRLPFPSVRVTEPSLTGCNLSGYSYNLRIGQRSRWQVWFAPVALRFRGQSTSHF